MREIATLAWRHTSRRRGRTVLTVLGIAIGFGAIIAILSLTFGVQRSVERTFDPIANDAIVVPLAQGVSDQPDTPSRPMGQVPRRRTLIQSGYIDEEAFNELIQLPGVESYIARSSQIPIQTYFRQRQISLPAMAIDPEAEAELGQIVLESGSWPGYKEALAGQILVRIAGIGEGDRIALTDEEGNTHEITVSGLVSAAREARFGAPPNTPLFITFETARIFTNQSRYSTLVLTASDREGAREIADLVQAGYPNLTALTFEDFTETIESTLNQYSLFLLSIGILAVAVAALGSANTMVVSTMERTREIGIMKATGAKSGFILRGFLLESLLLGLAGGVIGVLFGYLGSRVLEFMVFRLNIASIGQTSAFSPYIPLWLIPFSIVLAMLVTLISGSVPAYRASKLDPVEAIRYE